jgi:predicted DNA binding CopG/RHH family protein
MRSITIWLRDELFEQIEKRALERGLSLSSYGRMLLLEYLKQKEAETNEITS